MPGTYYLAWGLEDRKACHRPLMCLELSKACPTQAGTCCDRRDGHRCEAVTCVLGHGGEGGRRGRRFPVAVCAPAGVAAQRGQGLQGLDSAEGAGDGRDREGRRDPQAPTHTGWRHPAHTQPALTTGAGRSEVAETPSAAGERLAGYSTLGTTNVGSGKM